MTEFQTVAQVGDIPDGEGRTYTVGGFMVGVFRSADEYHAINDLCPHMGASLASGYFADGSVTCPWHAWRFCVKEGTWLDNPESKLRTESFPVRIVDGEIQVQVPARETPPPAD